MKEYRVDVGRGFSEIPAWGNALESLSKLGVRVVKAYQHVFEKRTICGSQDVSGPIVYFANKDGDEVAYWTEGLNTLVIFDTPRKVAPSFMESARFLPV